MLRLTVVLALVVAVGLAVPVFAGDIVDMPTGNMVAPNHAEFNYIFWDVDFGPSPAPQNIHIFEGFVGVTDWLELDGIVASVDNDKTYARANAYVRLLAERPDRPSLIVGATNLTGADVPGGASDEPSPFFVSSYNIHVPAGPPSLKDPLIRMHFAWGTQYHGKTPFGGVQMLITPKLGLAAFNYQGEGAYMAAYQINKMACVRAGWKANDPFYSFGLNFNW